MQPAINPGTSGEETSPASHLTGMQSRNEMRNTKNPGHGCIRKMSRCERLFFMGPLFTVIMAARITGAVDTIRLRQALDAASRKHPLLRAKVVFD